MDYARIHDNIIANTMFNINKDVAAKIIKTNRIPNKHRLIFARIEKL